MHAQVTPQNHPAVARLQALLGADHVLLDAADREFYSSDIYRSNQTALCVVRPASTADVAQIVLIAREHELPIVPRGGGASYSDGYVPAEPNSILIDTSRMNRIVEINERDMYVVAQAGVTWAALAEALAAKGLRTPFFGPFSGIAATLGGALSQGAVTWGTGVFGISGENVLGVEVVLGNGEVVRTGSWGSANGVPFLRLHGPDLTGIFMSDSGALGIKTTIALRLMPRREHVLGLSFGFKDFASLAAGLEAAGREGLNLTNFGLDPALQQGQLGKADVATGLQAAAAVFKTSRGFFDGLKQVAKIAFAGRGFLRGATYSGHWLVDGVDRAAVLAHAGRLREVLQPYGAEVPATMPTIVNAMPFMPLYNVRGPKGERWVPVHGLLPYSRVAAFHADLLAYIAANQERMKRHQITFGSMFMTVSTNVFLYEPVFYWHDVQTLTHQRLVPADYLATLPKYADNPDGRAIVDEMKRGIADLFHKHGAAHMQIGKFYPYLRGRDPQTAKLVRDLKALMDPKRRLNPGALGL